MRADNDQWALPNEHITIQTSIHTLVPRFEDLPEDYRYERGEAKRWIDIVVDMFYHTCRITKYEAHDGIHAPTALKHCRYVMQSWDISHEQKMSGVAYLMSRWFKIFEYVLVEKRDGEKTIPDGR